MLLCSDWTKLGQVWHFPNTACLFHLTGALKSPLWGKREAQLDSRDVQAPRPVSSLQHPSFWVLEYVWGITGAVVGGWGTGGSGKGGLQNGRSDFRERIPWLDGEECGGVCVCVWGGGLAPAVSEGLQRAWSPARLPGCLCGGEGEPAGCPPDHRPTQQERSWAQARPGSQRRDDAGRKSPHGPQAQCHPHGSPFRSLILLLRLSNKKQIPAGPATHRGLGECQWGLTTSSCCFLSLSPSSPAPVSCRVLFPLAPRPGSSLEPHFQLCTLAACPPAWPPQACEAHGACG